MISEKMIEDVREYLADDNDVAIECLKCVGDYDWLNTYTLYDLYNDYCGGDIEEVINLFVDAGFNASSYYEYFIDGYGDLKESDDLCYEIDKALTDDNLICEIIEEINCWNINVPDDLYDLCHSATVEDVQDAITKANKFILGNSVDLLKNEDDLDWYLTVCKSVAMHDRIYNALMRITSTCSEDDCNILIGIVWENVIPSIVQFATGFCKAGVTVEKATEVWIKNNVLEG